MCFFLSPSHGGCLEVCEGRLVNSPLPVSHRFRKGFESEPTLHSGINYAVLLVAAGHRFDTSFELRKVGE